MRQDEPGFDLSRVSMMPRGNGQVGQAGRVGRAFKGSTLFDRVVTFLTDYVVLPDLTPVVIAAWVMAAWQPKVWDQFPHLAITSPEKRCGKTTLLQLLACLTPMPVSTSNISPAVLYRLIEARKPTLLFDEAQSLSRRGSEASEVNRELLNASVKRNASVWRCDTGKKKDYTPKEFSIYCPKVFALIGALDSVLADRSLPVEMRRKTNFDTVQRYRSWIVEARGQELCEELRQWAKDNEELVTSIYEDVDPFNIENDRMAELLMPLQSVLMAVNSQDGLEMLEEYATELDERDKRQETQSHGVRMLAACREIFGDEAPFLSTDTLIEALKGREEEPWYRWNHGDGINPEGLAKLLRPYGIKPAHNKRKTARGYHASDFKEAWERYLPPVAVSEVPPRSPSSQSKASSLSSNGARPTRPTRPEESKS